MDHKDRLEQETKPGEPEDNAAKKEEKRENDYDVCGILHDFIYLFAIIAILFVFVVRLVRVDGDSMYPTLHHADFLLLLSSEFYRDIEPGDVVVITPKHGELEGTPIVKRVIATGGQTVDIDFARGIVYVDGAEQDEPYINEPTLLSYNEYAMGMTYPLTVPRGSVFVMGDNRNHSADSRYAPLGFVDEREVLGKVLCLIFPGKGASGGGESRYADCREWNFGRIGLVS